MNPLDYLHFQLRLEGKEVVKDNLLRQVEIVPDEEMPLLLIAQLSDEQLVAYFDETLQTKLCAELIAQIPNIAFPNIDSLTAVLEQRNIQYEVGHYKTYIFPEQFASFKDEAVICYSRYAPKVKDFGFDGFPESVYGIEQDSRIISACVSARENDFCGEAWVYTDAEYRHQGFAQKVVSTWAESLITDGKIPFYSHKLENSASARLASKLGLQPVFEEIALIQI